MTDWKMYTPEGTGDILLERSRKRIRIEGILRETYVKSGFLETISPTIEFYDAFAGDNSPIGQETMYKLLDNQGRILVLRPDATIPMARIAATKLREFGHPLRLCYNLNVFRMNQLWDGKLREITQSGIEIIGSDSFMADADVIATAINALINAGISDFKIELGQVDFLNGILEEIELDPEDKKNLILLIENKNLPGLKEFLGKLPEGQNEILEALKELPYLFGTAEVIERAGKLTKNTRALKALENIDKIYRVLDELGLGDHVSVDLGMVQDIHYYTGVIFKGYLKEVGEAVLSGGRYDSLMERFGSNTPATGLAINIDGLLMCLEKKSEINSHSSKGILISYEKGVTSKACSIASSLRKMGFIAELSLSSDENVILEYSRKRGYKMALSLLECGRVKLWNTAAGEYEYIDLEEFMKVMEG